MNTINKKQGSIAVAIIAVALVMAISPIGLNNGNNLAFAGGHHHHHHHHHHHNNGNSASQSISQSQKSSQNSQVVSGGDSVGSGNNFNFQNQENSGNNALGQQ